MPLVQNLFGGQQPQQGGNTNPLSFLFQPPQQTPQTPQTQQPQQGAQNVNLGTFVNNMATSMGIQDQPQNALDILIKAAISNLQMSDVMALVNGDWTVLESSRDPLKKHIEEQVLDGDTSRQAREKVIENALEHLKTATHADTELMDAIRQRTKTPQDVDALIEEGIEVVRTYFTIAMDIVLDGVYEAQQRYPNMLRVPPNHPKPYSTAIRQFITLFSGELLDLMNAHFANPTDSNAITMILAQRLLSGLPENFGHLSLMGANMLVGFVNRNYLVYKQEYPNRPPSRTKAPSSPSSVPTTPTTSSATPETPKPISTPVSQPVSRVSAPSEPRAQPRPQQQQQQQQPWYQHLSDTEREMIEETIKEDESKMRLPPSSVKSEAYTGKKAKEVSFHIFLFNLSP
jgi:hypothetical protein